MSAALGEGLLRLRRTRVRFPPPPRAVRLHTCRSERTWRCADTSQDTARTRKDTEPCPGVGVLVWNRRPRTGGSNPRLDQVEELLTARPSTPRRAGDLGPRFRKGFGVRGARRRRPLGRRRRMRPLPKISFEKFLCPAGPPVTRCVSLARGGYRWIPLLTWQRCHTDAPPWPPWIPTTTPCSKHSSATGGDARSTASWLRATAAAGAAVPIRLRGFVVSGRPGEQAVTFSSASLPDGVVLKACGSRSEIRCPSCAAIYRGDSRHLVRAGLEGGKGVDEVIALHPAVFLTLTAPSFGSVHTASGVSPCHAWRCPGAVRSSPTNGVALQRTGAVTSWSALPSAPIATTTRAPCWRTRAPLSYGAAR